MAKAIALSNGAEAPAKRPVLQLSRQELVAWLEERRFPGWYATTILGWIMQRRASTFS